jgi:hypothetical protein
MCPELVAMCPELVAMCPELVAMCPELVAMCPELVEGHASTSSARIYLEQLSAHPPRELRQRDLGSRW